MREREGEGVRVRGSVKQITSQGKTDVLTPLKPSVGPTQSHRKTIPEVNEAHHYETKLKNQFHQADTRPVPQRSRQRKLLRKESLKKF